MSAKNRKKKSVKGDLYLTPEWCVHRLLEAQDFGLLNSQTTNPWPGRPKLVLEPACGEGHIIRAVNSWLEEKGRFRPTWMALDVRRDAEKRTTDALDIVPFMDDVPRDFMVFEPQRRPRYQPEETVDIIITNPPYSLALDFAMAATSMAPQVALLLRLNWLATAFRNDWLRSNTPSIYVLPNRPSFCDGRTDATEYAWMVWDGGEPTVNILRRTPRIVRKMQEMSIADLCSRYPEYSEECDAA